MVLYPGVTVINNAGVFLFLSFLQSKWVSGITPVTTSMGNIIKRILSGATRK